MSAENELQVASSFQAESAQQGEMLIPVENQMQAACSSFQIHDELTDAPQEHSRSSGTRRRTSLFQRGAQPDRHSHRIPGTQYFALMVWTVLLLLDYAWTRVICLTIGVPPDCSQKSDIALVMHDFEYLLFSGVVLAILTGIHWPDRFVYIFDFNEKGRCPRAVVFLVTLFGSSLAWGSFSLVPGLKGFSITPGMSGLSQFLLIVVLLGAVLLIGWHVRTAWQHNSWFGFLAYVLSRTGIVIFYVGHLLVIPGHDDVHFHFHHYVIGYLAASLAEFNHPLSLLLLSIGTGVYVQGIAAYHADPIIERDSNQQRVFWNTPNNGEIVSPLVSLEAAQWIIDHCRLNADPSQTFV